MSKKTRKHAFVPDEKTIDFYCNHGGKIVEEMYTLINSSEDIYNKYQDLQVLYLNTAAALFLESVLTDNLIPEISEMLIKDSMTRATQCVHPKFVAAKKLRLSYKKQFDNRNIKFLINGIFLAMISNSVEEATTILKEINFDDSFLKEKAKERSICDIYAIVLLKKLLELEDESLNSEMHNFKNNFSYKRVDKSSIILKSIEAIIEKDDGKLGVLLKKSHEFYLKKFRDENFARILSNFIDWETLGLIALARHFGMDPNFKWNRHVPSELIFQDN